MSSIDPELERMLAESRERGRRGYAGRVRWVNAGFSAGFLVAAVTLAVVAPADRAFDPVLAATLVAAYAIVGRVEFAAGAGTVVPTQVVFVPMLLLLPVPLVPLAVATALVCTDVVRAAQGRTRARQAFSSLADAWFSVAPALVLVLAGAQTPDWGDAPWYAAALVAQLAGDAASSRWSTASTRSWRRSGC
jgi:hypothetical protein